MRGFLCNSCAEDLAVFVHKKVLVSYDKSAYTARAVAVTVHFSDSTCKLRRDMLVGKIFSLYFFNIFHIGVYHGYDIVIVVFLIRDPDDHGAFYEGIAA